MKHIDLNIFVTSFQIFVLSGVYRRKTEIRQIIFHKFVEHFETPDTTHIQFINHIMSDVSKIFIFLSIDRCLLVAILWFCEVSDFELIFLFIPELFFFFPVNLTIRVWPDAWSSK